MILANCYPFWEGCPADYSLLYMKDMYRRAVKAGKGKRVIITETGWPNIGTAERGAEEEYIEIFYFSSFDEPWKGSPDSLEPEKHWGLFFVDRTPKLVMKDLYPCRIINMHKKDHVA